MKKILTAFLMIALLSPVAFAQEEVSLSEEASKSFFDQLSFTLKSGTPSIPMSDLGSSGKHLSNIGIAEIGTAFKANSNFSFGISAMGGLGNCAEGYYDNEGVFIEFEDDDIDDDDDMDDDGGEDDGDEDECDGDEPESLMATATYTISENIPVFVQASAGYNFDSSAPAYSILVGYNQQIFSQLSISGGFRFSEVLINVPSDAQEFSRSGLKAEVGLHWNF